MFLKCTCNACKTCKSREAGRRYRNKQRGGLPGRSGRPSYRPYDPNRLDMFKAEIAQATASDIFNLHDIDLEARLSLSDVVKFAKTQALEVREFKHRAYARVCRATRLFRELESLGTLSPEQLERLTRD